MNFLSHFYVRHQIQNPYFTLGKIMPDMLRHYGPSSKLREAPNKKAPKNSSEWLDKGVFVHLQTDRIFHQSPFFEEKSGMLKQWLHSENIFHRFRYFYAHVLLELLIDRLLVKHHEKVAKEFYDQLILVQQATLSDYFRYKGLTLNQEKFARHLKRFIASRYLFNYRQNEGLIFALERTTSSIGLPLFEKSDKTGLINNLDHLEATVEADYLSIFKKLEKEIPE